MPELGTGSFALPGSSTLFFFGRKKRTPCSSSERCFGELEVAAGELTDAASEAGAALVSAVCFLSLFFFSCRCVVSDVLVFSESFEGRRVPADLPPQLLARRARAENGAECENAVYEKRGRDSAHRDLSFARRSRHSAMAKRTRLLRVNTTMLAGLGRPVSASNRRRAPPSHSAEPEHLHEKARRRTLVM